MHFVSLSLALFAPSSGGFVNTDAHTKYAVWSIVDTLNGSLKMDIGKARERFAFNFLLDHFFWLCLRTMGGKVFRVL
jgi:hypothetical protein